MLPTPGPAPSGFPTEYPQPCGYLRFAYQQVRFHGLDEDGNGTLDRVVGDVGGRGDWLTGDVAGSFDFVGTLDGAVDTQGSPLHTGASHPLHPLEGMTVLADEPISATTLEVVDPTSGAVLQAGAFVAADATQPATRFYRVIAPLPYGASLRVQPAAGSATPTETPPSRPPSRRWTIRDSSTRPFSRTPS